MITAIDELENSNWKDRKYSRSRLVFIFKTFFPYYCRSKFFQEMTTNVNMLSAWVKSLSLFTLGNLHCTEPKNLWIEYALLFFISALLVSTDPRSVLLPFQKNSSQGSQTTKPAHQWYRRIKGLFYHFLTIFFLSDWEMA